MTLIEAAAPLKEVPLYIVGDGEAMPEVQRLVEENECEHIHLLGFKQGDELRDLILNSICTVLPSEWYENCPMSVLESYAYGKPVIGANIGGIPELIVDGVDGFLVPSGGCETLRDRLLWMSEHRDEAVEMDARVATKWKQSLTPTFTMKELWMSINDFCNPCLINAVLLDASPV